MNEPYEELLNDYDYLSDRNFPPEILTIQEYTDALFLSPYELNYSSNPEHEKQQEFKNETKRRVYFKIIRNPIRKEKTKKNRETSKKKSENFQTTKQNYNKLKNKKQKKQLPEATTKNVDELSISANSNMSTINSDSCSKKKSRAKPESKLKRMLRNRANAQRVRERQKKYTRELELKILEIQADYKRVQEENRALRTQLTDFQSFNPFKNIEEKPFDRRSEAKSMMPVADSDIIIKKNSENIVDEEEEEKVMMEENPKIIANSKRTIPKKSLSPGMIMFYALLLSTLFGYINVSGFNDNLVLEMTNKGIVANQEYFSWNYYHNFTMEEDPKEIATTTANTNELLEKGKFTENYNQFEPGIKLRLPDLRKFIGEEAKLVHLIKPSFENSYLDEEESKRMELDHERIGEKGEFKKADQRGNLRKSDIFGKAIADERNFPVDPAFFGEDTTEMAWFG